MSANIPDVVEQAYNNLPYTHFPYSKTHPTHLFTLATLYGLQPKPVAQARVLELGCAAGGNLLPMACHFPQTQFLGIDLSSVQIDSATQQAQELQLSNIVFKHQSFLDFSASEGKFDYIICHGVYSWVESAIRDKILAICQQHLTENGIACISYNTYPGWHLLDGLKDLMVWYTKDIQNPQVKVKKARQILTYLQNALKNIEGPYQKICQTEMNNILENVDTYLFHEYLEKTNQPVYFYQFMDEIKKHDLQYLCDAYLIKSFIDILPSEFAEKLQAIDDRVMVNQLVDFFYNQRFHHTLITHHAIEINHQIPLERMQQFYYKLNCNTDKPDLTAQDIGKLAMLNFTNGVCHLKVKNPIAQHFMLLLLQHKNQFMLYDAIIAKLAAVGPIENSEALKQFLAHEINLLSMVLGGLVDISAHPLPFQLLVTEKPLACPLARYLAKRQHFITNRQHDLVKIDPVTKALLPYLDGQHTLADLVIIAKKLLNLEELTLLDHLNQPITDERIMTEHVQTVCLKSLHFLAQNAVLIG